VSILFVEINGGFKGMDRSERGDAVKAITREIENLAACKKTKINIVSMMFIIPPLKM